MKKNLSLFVSLLVITIIGMTFVSMTSAQQTAYASSGTSKASITLDGYGDEPQLQPNQPAGPQGNSSLASGGLLPNTNEQVHSELKLLGLLSVLLVGFYYWRQEQRRKKVSIYDKK